jgi:hypothetical protein
MGFNMKRILPALATVAAVGILATGIASQASASNASTSKTSASKTSPGKTSAGKTSPGRTGIGIQLLDGTAPDTGWMQASIPQGGSKAWHVKITNAGTAAETIAAIPSSALGFYAGGPAKQPSSTLQSWITQDRSGPVVLSPGQSTVIAVTVTVPAGAPLGLVSGYAPGASASLAANAFWGYAYPAGGQIRLATAAGVRMYITVTRGR